REIRPFCHLRQYAPINQLIQQQRIRCDLLREEITMPAKLHEPGTRRSALLEQSEIRGALSDCLDDSQHSLQHGEVSSAGGNIRQQRGQETLQPFPAWLIELAN